MGHQRLGDIPKTQRWNAVVETVTGGGGASGVTVGQAVDVPEVAAVTLVAADAGLNAAVNDEGLRYTFYLLAQFVLAAREDDWQAGLAEQGIRLSPDSSLFDFTSEVHKAVDEHVSRHGRATTISEMAQQAAGEAIASLAGPTSVTLFGTGSEELQRSLRQLSTKAGFAKLGQRFFGCFMARFLNFYLSRVTASQVGSNRLPDTADLSTFDEALRTHCQQSARIVHDFCGEWYSKTEFQKGIDLASTSGFMAVAVRKLQDELRNQREAS
ncbi:MAG TPA: hypothetical protein VKD90_22215 [Gemmataceae bacterium]|nr:hypothetical protein [Gemmataceae bacterium]